jgi:GTP-binding protein
LCSAFITQGRWRINEYTKATLIIIGSIGRMIIKTAEFVKSAVKASHYPPAELQEIAFGGRSNVGKSTLINTLLNRKRLVKTGSTPGRTQLINFFLINNDFHLVDLPGFGYAKVPLRVRKQWGPMVETYLAQRSTLQGVVFLLDIRRKPSDEDFKFHDWLRYYNIPIIFVLTKSDKLSRSKQQKQTNMIAQALSLNKADPICFSAKTRQGKDTVWKSISTLIG